MHLLPNEIDKTCVLLVIYCRKTKPLLDLKIHSHKI